MRATIWPMRSPLWFARLAAPAMRVSAAGKSPSSAWAWPLATPASMRRAVSALPAASASASHSSACDALSCFDSDRMAALLSRPRASAGRSPAARAPAISSSARRVAAALSPTPSSAWLSRYRKSALTAAGAARAAASSARSALLAAAGSKRPCSPSAAMRAASACGTACAAAAAVAVNSEAASSQRAARRGVTIWKREQTSMNMRPIGLRMRDERFGRTGAGQEIDWTGFCLSQGRCERNPCLQCSVLLSLGQAEFNKSGTVCNRVFILIRRDRCADLADSAKC